MAEQWLPSASDQEDMLPISEDVARAYVDGRNEGRRDERARIRAELLAWLIGDIGEKDAGLVAGRRIVDEINRICPEEVSRG